MERHEKWVRVEPGTTIPAGQPYRVEYPVSNPPTTEARESVSAKDFGVDTHPYNGENVEWFIDSSWKPPLVLPTEPGAMAKAVIDAIEETFLPHLPSEAISYCAQEDVYAGLDALRERFGLEGTR